MTRRRIFLWIQTVLCILLCVLSAAAFIGIYREGMTARAAGEAASPIYTRETVVERLAPIVPLFTGSFLFTLVGLFLGIRDESPDKPVKDAMATGKRVMRENTLKAVRICILVLAFTLIIHGIFNGSMRDVLFKAARICTECVGLG